MGLDKILFDPYKPEGSFESVITIVLTYLDEAPLETVLEEFAQRIYFDNSLPWKKIITSLFQGVHGERLAQLVPIQFNKLVSENRVDILQQYMYFVTSLISTNLIKSDFLTTEIVSSMQDSKAKDILFSFLSSWDLSKALELDNYYTITNYSHLIEAKKIPIRNLILDPLYFNVVQNLLSDNSVQFHFNQEIQRVIKKGERPDFVKLEAFFVRCCNDVQDHVVEFVSDLLELSTVQSFLKSSWDITLIQNLYNEFSKNQQIKSHSLIKNSLSAINKLKNRQISNFAVAARHQINKLSKNDRVAIHHIVEQISSQNIIEYQDIVRIPFTSNWDWKDFAYSLIHMHREKNPGKEYVDVIEISKELGIEVIVENFETDQFDACLVRDTTLKAPIVIINKSKKSSGRVNFSIAHELAHAVIPSHSKQAFFCFLDDITESNKFVMNNQLEIEANKFASYILLPDREFRIDFSKLDYSISSVENLSTKYRASMVLVAKKWVELSNLDIAMVFSSNGLVDWACFSETFPFKWVESIDQLSSVFDAISSNQRKHYRKTVSSNNWFNEEHPRYILQEESFKIFDGKVLTLLQITDED